MAVTRVSRREFVRLGAAGAAAAPWLLEPAALGAATISAQAVIDRVRKALGLEWKASRTLYLIFDPTSIAIPVPQLSGAPFGYPQYRFTIGLQLGA